MDLGKLTPESAQGNEIAGSASADYRRLQDTRWQPFDSEFLVTISADGKLLKFYLRKTNYGELSGRQQSMMQEVKVRGKAEYPQLLPLQKLARKAISTNQRMTLASPAPSP